MARSNEFASGRAQPRLAVRCARASRGTAPARFATKRLGEQPRRNAVFLSRHVECRALIVEMGQADKRSTDMDLVKPRAATDDVSWTPRFRPRNPNALKETGQVAALHNFPPDAEALFGMGARMHRAAMMRGGSVSLLVLQVQDLPEVELIFGRDAAERVVHAVMAELTHISAQRGHVLRTSADTFALLMPDVSGEDLHGALQVRLGKACAVESDIDGQELLLVPDVMARTLSKSDSVRAAFESLCRMLAAERRLNVASCAHLSRERHDRTIPMPIAPQRHAVPTPRAADAARYPATIPMDISGARG